MGIVGVLCPVRCLAALKAGGGAELISFFLGIGYFG